MKYFDALGRPTGMSGYVITIFAHVLAYLRTCLAKILRKNPIQMKTVIGTCGTVDLAEGMIDLMMYVFFITFKFTISSRLQSTSKCRLGLYLLRR